jgi:hypothetical protein
LRILSVLTVRNEAAFLLEWLAHHRAVGVTDVLVFSNDCQDGSDAMLDRLEDMGWLTHLRNDGPYEDRGAQFTALKNAQDHPLVQSADWILPLDIDEFVNVKTGTHTLPALFDALPEATAITLTWRLFGNGGVIRYKDAPITETFTRCAPEVINWPWRASMFKTLFRNDDTYRALGVHRPRSPDPDRVAAARWFDCEGRELRDQFKTRRIFSDFGRPNCKLAQLNHYPLGAMESFVLKSDRGRAVHGADQLGMDYWIERNFNIAEDTSIQAVNPLMRTWREELLADSALNRLHHQAVTWRTRRFEALMHEEPYRALFGRLLMAGPSRMVSSQGAQFMVRFAQSPDDSSDG